MEISAFDKRAVPFSAEVTLSAEEIDALIHSAYARLAHIFKRSESDVRAYTKQLMTAREIQTFLKETIVARAGEKALATLDVPFVGAPRTEAESDCAEHAPFSFRVTAHPIPAMLLDTETPITRRCGKEAGSPAEHESARSDATASDTAKTSTEAARPAAETDRPETRSEKNERQAVASRKASEKRRAEETAVASDEEFVAETLRARLNGVIPETLLRDALARKKDAFLARLGEKGITYREYRIAHGVKPQEVQDALYDEAFDELSRDIALDTLFFTQNLAIASEDEQAVLTEMAPGREKSLYAELEATGKLWMLRQKTRRAAALRWAVEHLLIYDRR
ncbi:MAG: hypothetical protein Q4B69_02860 [Slackia sp.]|nr:hypothetical protein [Slackia sp.]